MAIATEIRYELPVLIDGEEVYGDEQFDVGYP